MRATKNWRDCCLCKLVHRLVTGCVAEQIAKRYMQSDQIVYSLRRVWAIVHSMAICHTHNPPLYSVHEDVAGRRVVNYCIVRRTWLHRNEMCNFVSESPLGGHRWRRCSSGATSMANAPLPLRFDPRTSSPSVCYRNF